MMTCPEKTLTPTQVCEVFFFILSFHRFTVNLSQACERCSLSFLVFLVFFLNWNV